MDIKNERHVLVVFPHPDDEAFGVSGTMAAYIENGIPVTYACLTLGEMGRNLGDPPFATRESLPLIRKEELKNAAKVLGLEDLRMLGYRDKTVEFEDPEKIIADITSIINEVNPSLIITFYPGYAVHPDHDATGAAVVQAVERIAPSEASNSLFLAFSNGCEQEIGQADIVHDVTEFAPKKIACLLSHQSQVQLFSGLEEKYALGDPDVVERVTIERFWTYKF